MIIVLRGAFQFPGEELAKEGNPQFAAFPLELKRTLSHHYRWINMDSVLFVGVVDNVDKPRAALFYRICRVSLADNYLPIGVDRKNVSNFSCG
jgi:hypothetical protein